MIETAVIGSVGCSYYEDLQETGITYFIGAQYRDNGYAVEAVKAYADYFFNHYNAKRMYKDLNGNEGKLYRFYETPNKNQIKPY